MRPVYQTGWLTRVVQFVRDEQGPTATEYAVMLALIIIAAIVSISVYGSQLQAMYAMIHTEVEPFTAAP